MKCKLKGTKTELAQVKEKLDTSRSETAKVSKDLENSKVEEERMNAELIEAENELARERKKRKENIQRAYKNLQSPLAGA